MKTLTFTLDKKLAKFVSVACGKPVTVSIKRQQRVAREIITAAQRRQISLDLMWASERTIMEARDRAGLNKV